MISMNQNYQNLQENYLFAEINTRIKRFQSTHPDTPIIRMGIGDVTRPLPPVVIQAMHDAVDEMGSAETFRGYGPEQGYDFLRDAIRRYYQQKGVSLESEDIFISDGAKSDIGNILDIFGTDNTVLITNPVYPVYLDTNIMSGSSIVFQDASEDNGFLPLPSPDTRADLIYLCSPGNPTGAVYTHAQLKAWVDYANANGSILLFDAAYEAFVMDRQPRSIYEIEGASACAIEFSSLSKTAGFTGMRCGYTVVPKGLVRSGLSLRSLWLRRQTTKFNGVSYVVQRGAAAVFTEEGLAQVRETIGYYQQNAAMITDALDQLNIPYTGGRHSPYIWLKCPRSMDSWRFFDYLLEHLHIVGTPGAGFGSQGDAYFRLTSFSTQENTREAMRRLTSHFL